MDNRNPLIENRPEDTLLNIHSILTLVQELHANSEFNETAPRTIKHGGLALILRCTNDALSYEMQRLEYPENKAENSVIFEA